MNKRYTRTSNYYRYVPGETTVNTGFGRWNEIGLSVYSLPYNLEPPPPTPGIPDFGLSCVYAGNAVGTCTIEQTRWQKRHLKKGMGLIIPPYQGVAWEWRSLHNARENVKAINIFLSSTLFSRIADETLDIDPNRIEIPAEVGFHDELACNIALELKAEAENNLPLGKLFGDTAAQFLAVHLLRKYSTIQRKIPKYHFGLSRQQLDKVLEYINAHLNADISLQIMADLCGLSAYHFARMFKDSTGLPPHQYIIHRKMEKAEELLRHTNWSILRIALELGYESHSHFTALFKKATGVTPSQYRKQI